MKLLCVLARSDEFTKNDRWTNLNLGESRSDWTRESRGQNRGLPDIQLQGRIYVDAQTNPSAPMVTPQLWNCQTGVSGCWCGQSRCCWLWEPHKEWWSQSLMTPCCSPTYSSARQHPSLPTSTPMEPACLPHVSPRTPPLLLLLLPPLLAPQSRINRQGYPSAKKNIIPPLQKPGQVKCGLIWRSDTTFACELHNCYGLRELKPLIRTTWWICRSVFEHEIETNFQSQSILRNWHLISAVPDISGPGIQWREMWLDSALAFNNSYPLPVFQRCLVWRWQVATDPNHTMYCSTSVTIA